MPRLVGAVGAGAARAAAGHARQNPAGRRVPGDDSHRRLQRRRPSMRGTALRVQTTVEGVTQDFGTLSAKTVVTGDDGRARVIYTAPARPRSP